MTKISLIIPIYNAEKYLSECLQSVAEQSYQDFECLCINDGSSDTSEEIVKAIVEKDTRFVLINQPNSGCSAARNTGIAKAQGEYLAFLDQDDALHPQALEMLLKMIEKHNADAATFAYQNVAESFKIENVPHYETSDLHEELIDNPWDDFFKNKKGASVVVWTRLYRRSVFGGLNFPCDVQPAEDSVYTLKFLQKCQSLVRTELPLMYYRDSATSIMNRGITAKYVRSHLKACCDIYEYFIASGILSEKKEKQLRYYLARMFYKTTISQVLRCKNFDPEMIAWVVAELRKLRASNIFEPQVLELRKRLAICFYLKGMNEAAKLFV